MRRNQRGEGTRKPGKGYMPEGGWDPVYVLRPSVALSKGARGGMGERGSRETGEGSVWTSVRMGGDASGLGTPSPRLSLLEESFGWTGRNNDGSQGKRERPGRGKGNAQPQTS